MHEIIWHGRGGQGVVLAAQILAESAYLQGFQGVTSAPTFGPERRGAPLTASTRISDALIRTVSQVESAHIAIVLDASLLSIVDVTGSLKERGTLIVNTPHPPGELGIEGMFKTASVDASGIALEQQLTIAGAPVVNTPMLGAFGRVTGLVSLDNIEKALQKKMPGDRAAANFAAAGTAFEKTLIQEIRET
jgi:2-oxoacid:acceptor oxidoreductase gamma subunit (pyruvate/2-ketoisovalerate family)